MCNLGQAEVLLFNLNLLWVRSRWCAVLCCAVLCCAVLCCGMQGVDAAKACSDAAHRAVRLGNPLVALSMIDKDDFSQIFDGNVSGI